MGKQSHYPHKELSAITKPTQAKIAAEGTLHDLSGLLQGNATC